MLSQQQLIHRSLHTFEMEHEEAQKGSPSHQFSKGDSLRPIFDKNLGKIVKGPIMQSSITYKNYFSMRYRTHIKQEVMTCWAEGNGGATQNLLLSRPTCMPPAAKCLIHGQASGCHSSH